MTDSKYDLDERQVLLEILRIGEQERINGNFLAAEIVFIEIEKEDNSIANGEHKNSYEFSTSSSSME